MRKLSQTTVSQQGQAPGQDPLAFLGKTLIQIQNLSKEVNMTNQSLKTIPPTQLSPVAAGQNPQVQLNILQQQFGEVQKIQDAAEDVKSQTDQLIHTINNMMDATQKTVNRTMENANAVANQSSQSSQGATAITPTASKRFNLKTAQMDLNNPIKENLETDQQVDVESPAKENVTLKDEIKTPRPTVSGLEWRTAADLMNFLNRDRMDRLKAESILMELVPEEQKEMITSLLEEYYEGGDLTEESKLEIAVKIWHMLPDIVRADSPQVEENIMPLNIQSFVKQLVKEANEEIKKLAQKDASSHKEAKTVFNLTKTAQHKSMDNVILYGPDQVYMDEFTRQPASKWSLIERNKGFGLVVDDVWDIDWESIWRGNIMDKYSRPYRNDKGEWVGGYINKRFEVDHWIPEGNNYQLLPGERRRAYVPEQRSLEARMVAQRASGDAPYESSDKSKPFNWKEASSKKKS